MKGGAFFGYRCPNCNSKIDIAAVAGSSKFTCSNCWTEMVPDSKGQASATKVYCPQCKSYFGLVNSDTCPHCGEPIESVD
jgi:DNA-directed RNA polymerase subunit RPC12/RpoP